MTKPSSNHLTKPKTHLLNGFHKKKQKTKCKDLLFFMIVCSQLETWTKNNKNTTME
jgi:hypothetical protein